jgi:hypothetical protein
MLELQISSENAIWGKNAVCCDIVTNHIDTLCVLMHRYTNSHSSLLAYDAVQIVLEFRSFRESFFLHPHGSRKVVDYTDGEEYTNVPRLIPHKSAVFVSTAVTY